MVLLFFFFLFARVVRSFASGSIVSSLTGKKERTANSLTYIRLSLTGPFSSCPLARCPFCPFPSCPFRQTYSAPVQLDLPHYTLCSLLLLLLSPLDFIFFLFFFFYFKFLCPLSFSVFRFTRPGH